MMIDLFQFNGFFKNRTVSSHHSFSIYFIIKHLLMSSIVLYVTSFGYLRSINRTGTSLYRRLDKDQWKEFEWECRFWISKWKNPLPSSQCVPRGSAVPSHQKFYGWLPYGWDIGQNGKVQYQSCKSLKTAQMTMFISMKI